MQMQGQVHGGYSIEKTTDIIFLYNNNNIDNISFPTSLVDKESMGKMFYWFWNLNHVTKPLKLLVVI